MRSVIVGGGIAGLALAVELTRLGCEATIVEQRYPGAGNSTRNVGRVRRMQLTADLTEFSCRAAEKWARLHRAIGGRNPLLYPTRYVWALYDEEERSQLADMGGLWREYGTRTKLVSADSVLEAVPIMRGGDRPVGGVIGEAAIVHHDAAVYGYLLAAREAGVRLEVGDAVVGLTTARSRASGVTTASGKTIEADVVVNAAGGRSGALATQFGVASAPNSPLRREVLVTEPSRPFMTPAVTFYRPQEGWFNQTLRGELVAGVVDVDEEPGFSEESSVRFLGRTARVLLRKAPRLAGLRVIRQWAGTYDNTPDKRPMVGEYPEQPGLYALNGWSGRGIAFAPLAAELLAAELAGHGRDPLLERFDPARFVGRDASVEHGTDYYSGYAH